MGSSKKVAKQKVCYVVTRYYIKRTGSVCCIVRNEQGKDYTTCVHANGSTSCTCPAVTKCYHIKHVVAVETARKEQAARERVNAALQAIATASMIKARPGQTPVTPCKGVAATSPVLPAASLSLGMSAACPVVPSSSVPSHNALYASLSSNKGFNLLG